MKLFFKQTNQLRLFCCIILLVIGIKTYGQTDGSFDAKLIDTINFSGLVNVRTNELKAAIREYIGVSYSDDILLEITDILYGLEYFRQVDYEVSPSQTGAGIIINFLVEEYPRVAKVIFEGVTGGLSGVSRSALREELFVADRNFYIEGTLGSDERALESKYRSKGFSAVKVTSRVEAVADRINFVNIVFQVEEGEKTVIRKVSFEGNNSISTRKLRTIPNLTLTPLSVAFGRDYEISDLENDKELISLTYKKDGFLDFEIKTVREKLIRRKESKNSRSTAIKFTELVFVLEEGKAYIYGGVKITGNSIFSTEELNSLFGQNIGDIFDFTRFQQEFESLRSTYFDIGYVLNSIDFTENRDETENIVSYDIEIIERSRALIESIEVRGNTVTKDHVILREIPLVAGSVFSRRELLRGIQNLSYTQYFSSVVPEVIQGSQPGFMKVIIHVEEGNTLSLSVGLDFTPPTTTTDTSFPIAGKFEFKDQNFLGLGYVFGSSLSVGTENQSVSAQFYNPKILGKNWSAGANLNFSHESNSRIFQDLDNNGAPDPFATEELYRDAKASTINSNLTKYGMALDVWNIGMGLNTGYSWGLPLGDKLSRLSLVGGYNYGFRYLEYDTDIYRPYDKAYRANNYNWQYKDSIIFKTSWDTRDLPNDPARGFILSNNSTLGGLLPTSYNNYYFKNQTRGDLYIPLIDLPVSDTWSFLLVLYLHTGFSVVTEHPWKPESINPQTNGFIINTFLPTGKGWNNDYGQIMWDNSIQLRFPFARGIASFDLFLDMLGLWRNFHSLDTSSFDIFRFSVGAGVRLTLAQLPLSLYFVKIFRTKDGAIDWVPEAGVLGQGFSISLSFNIDIYR